MNAFNLKLAIAALMACSVFTIPLARGHEGPEADIEELTERMKFEGVSAHLLLQRAIEYNVLSKSAEAIKDLERALELESHSPMIQRELSRTYFSSGKTNEALDTAARGIKYAEPGPDRASLLMVHCEVLRARKEFQKALEDADRAIRDHPENAEWYLMRSQLQEQLKLKKERIAGLEKGIKETGSGLLEAEWIDALIDGGKADLALEKIENELRDSRVRSSWLIRRAKVRLAAGAAAEARTDLEEALVELNARMNTTAPDPLLLADRGMTYELLLNKEDALKDYEKARDKGLTDDWLRERIRVLKDADKKKAEEKKPEENTQKADSDEDKAPQ